MHNKYEKLNNYDYQMIEAYIDNPEVTQWYVNAFSRFHINGLNLMRWHWSWWAFFGSVFFLLYRKAYTAAGILAVLLVLAWFIPLGWFVLYILTGGYSSYFVYKRYKEVHVEVEASTEDVDKRIESMAIRGGSNQWAIVVGSISQLILWGTSLFAVGFLLTFITFMVAVLANGS